MYTPSLSNATDEPFASAGRLHPFAGTTCCLPSVHKPPGLCPAVCRLPGFATGLFTGWVGSSLRSAARCCPAPHCAFGHRGGVAGAVVCASVPCTCSVPVYRCEPLCIRIPSLSLTKKVGRNPLTLPRELHSRRSSVQCALIRSSADYSVPFHNPQHMPRPGTRKMKGTGHGATPNIQETLRPGARRSAPNAPSACPPSSPRRKRAGSWASCRACSRADAAEPRVGAAAPAGIRQYSAQRPIRIYGWLNRHSWASRQLRPSHACGRMSV